MTLFTAVCSEVGHSLNQPSNIVSLAKDNQGVDFEHDFLPGMQFEFSCRC